MKTLRLSTAPRGNAALLGKLAMIENPHEVSDGINPRTHFTIPGRRVPEPPREAVLRNRYLRVIRSESMSPERQNCDFEHLPQDGWGTGAPAQVLFCDAPQAPRRLQERWQSG